MSPPCIRVFALASLLAIAPVSQAFADREPTPAERTEIEAALRAEGFVRWGEIELDDGKWEIDDAFAADDREYDLELDQSLRIVDRDLD